LNDRNATFQSQQHRNRIVHRVRAVESVDFFNVLTGPQLLEKTEACLPEHRERLYPPTVTLSIFMKQVLQDDSSCQKAVNGWAAQRAVDGLSIQSIRTGAYCKARQRLPLEMIQALSREAGRLLCAQARHGWCWQGRTVKLVDGTGISMPDTPKNQLCYPQPSSQAEGVGFPLARLVAVMCLSTGAVLDAAMGPHAGKGHSELDLFRSLLGALSAGDVLLADALYCNYFTIATLQSAGVDAVFEQNGSRATDFRRGTPLGERDHLVCWMRPRVCPSWMSPQQYQAFPDYLIVREVKVGGRILVTTMRDTRQAPKQELSRLYLKRWNAELDLRNLKTTLRMEVLRCLTPPMVQKELWIHLLAYNVIRILMAQAAHSSGMHPREISFKHTVQIWTEWACRSVMVMPDTNLFRLIAQVKIGNRPGRIEPRVRKRRPKSYPWLKIPRHQARRQLRTFGHLVTA